jgi:hypothetical protein
MKGKEAILVNYKNENVRCIYDAKERVFVDYPNTKCEVTVFPVTPADIKRNLRKLKLFTNGVFNKKGVLFLLSGLNSAEWNLQNFKSKMIETGFTTSEGKLTEAGVKFIKLNFAEKLTSIDGGDLALNEEGKETKLVKFVL